MSLYDPVRLQQTLSKCGASAALAVTAPNVRYLTQFPKAGRQAALATGARPEDPVLVASAGDLDFVIEDLDDRVEVRGYGRFVRDVMAGVELDATERSIMHLHESTRVDSDRDRAVADALEDRGIVRGTVVADAHPDDLGGISAALPDVDLVHDPGLFRQLRAVKSALEIERLTDVARITEVAIAAALDAAVTGTTQIELARAFRAALVPEDATLRLDNVSIGRSSAFGNANVPDDVLQEGSLIRFDVGAIKRGYQSDMSRCAVHVRADPRIVAGYRAVLAGQQAGLEQVRPGARACDIFDVTVAAVRAAGLPHYDRTHVGHGIGLSGDGYDPPLLAPGDDTPLEAGMVLCVETPYYELGLGGLQVEDMVVVTDDGFRYLTVSDRELRIVG
jgi:Xaa-Pro dipeptidase